MPNLVTKELLATVISRFGEPEMANLLDQLTFVTIFMLSLQHKLSMIQYIETIMIAFSKTTSLMANVNQLPLFFLRYLALNMISRRSGGSVVTFT